MTGGLALVYRKAIHDDVKTWKLAPYLFLSQSPVNFCVFECCSFFYFEQPIEQTMELPMIVWDTMTFVWMLRPACCMGFDQCFGSDGESTEHYQCVYQNWICAPFTTYLVTCPSFSVEFFSWWLPRLRLTWNLSGSLCIDILLYCQLRWCVHHNCVCLLWYCLVILYVFYVCVVNTRWIWVYICQKPNGFSVNVSLISSQHGKSITSHIFQWDVITHPYPNCNTGLLKRPLKLARAWAMNYIEWVITFPRFI